MVGGKWALLTTDTVDTSCLVDLDNEILPGIEILPTPINAESTFSPSNPMGQPDKINLKGQRCGYVAGKGNVGDCEEGLVCNNVDGFRTCQDAAEVCPKPSTTCEGLPELGCKVPPLFSHSSL